MQYKQKWERQYLQFLNLSVDEEILYIQPGTGWMDSIHGRSCGERYGVGYALRKVPNGMEVRDFSLGAEAESESYNFVPDDQILGKFQEIAREFREIGLIRDIQQLA